MSNRWRTSDPGGKTLLPEAPLAAWINAFSGLILAAFGLWVTRQQPVTKGNAALARFAIGFGIFWIPENLFVSFNQDHLLAGPALAIGAVAGATALIGLAGMIRHLPSGTEAGRTRRELIGWGSLVTLIGLLTLVTNLLVVQNDLGGLGEIRATRGILEVVTLGHIATSVFQVALGPAIVAVGLIYALREQRAQGEQLFHRYAAMATALFTYGLYRAGAAVPALPEGLAATGDLLMFQAGEVASLAWISLAETLAFLVALAAVACWGWNAAMRPAERGRAALGTVLWGTAMLAAGASYALFTNPPGGIFNAVLTEPITWVETTFGFTRMLAVGLLIHAVLRHQVLGLDVRVKWTLEKSTVAAIFVAVFFVFSEGATLFFENTTGNAVLGVLAAGALIFLLAPVQRLAARVAEAAMPGVKSVEEMAPPEKVQAYRMAAEQAWADGAMSQEERAMLETMREGLGLSEEEAFRVEREAAEQARETGPGGSSA